MVGLLLSEVLFGRNNVSGYARGLGLPSDGLILELFTTTCCSCYFVLSFDEILLLWSLEKLR
jgi:hypothetical protein